MSKSNWRSHSLRTPSLGFDFPELVADNVEDTFRWAAKGLVTLYEDEGTDSVVDEEVAEDGDTLPGPRLLQLRLTSRLLWCCSFDTLFMTQGFSLPSPDRIRRSESFDAFSVEAGISSYMRTSDHALDAVFAVVVKRDIFGAFLVGEESLLLVKFPSWLAAMFLSEAVIPSISTSLASATGVSSSIGVANSDNGRLPWLFLRGLGGTRCTGDGDNDGSFSFDAAAAS